MNGDLSVARRYAGALFEVAKKRNQVDAIAANLHEVVDAVRASRELMSVLHHPLLPLEKKQAVIRGVFGGKVLSDVENFVFLVVRKNRASVLPQIMDAFDRLVDEYRSEADAEAVTAVPLDANQVVALQASLQKKFGVKVRLKTRIDPEVLGGLQVRVGDRLIDATVRTKLERLNAQLKRVKVT
ncbi:F0F1 ATP synthase subunit delta [bacterium]|nr:MAG: F0F1 ATP synthase subunit delta [bacterium]